MKYVRVTVTLPEEVVKKIDKRKDELGLTRSGFLAFCVNKQFEYEKLLEMMPSLIAVSQNAGALKKAIQEEEN